MPGNPIRALATAPLLLLATFLQPHHAYILTTPRCIAQHRAGPPPVMMAQRLEELTVYELKAVCRAKGLKVSGRKADLIARVAAAPPGVLPDVAAKKPGRGRGRGRGRGGGRGSKAKPAASAAPPPTAAPEPPLAAAAPTVNGVDSSTATGVVSPANGVANPEPAFARSEAETVAEVLTQSEAEEVEDNERRERKRSERRAKLAGYFNEEFQSVVGALEIRAGESYAAAFGMPEDRLQLNPQTAARYLESIKAESGRRLAWCRAYDAASGRGVLVDLEERSEWAVDTRALVVNAETPVSSTMLYAGEFVEYDGDAARLFSNGGVPEAGWVCGILGFPLMCEVQVAAAAGVAA